MNTKEIQKRIADYNQQAEIALANYHRLKGAALALQSLLDSEPKVEQTAEQVDSSPVV